MSCLREIKRLKEGIIYIGELPEGCKICLEGGKLVLFITGLCNEKCWYCPINPAKRKDVIYANNRLVNKFEDILKEAYLMDAEGTGITGGEPLLVKERLLFFIKNLKKHLGKEHHIHLYTNGRLLTKAFTRELKYAGLDELRLHPISLNDLKKLAWVKEIGIDVGIEVPIIPGPRMFEYYNRLFLLAEKYGASFINMNELEFSEGNYSALRLRGLSLKPYSQIAAEGSEELALKIVDWAKENLSINIHYCAANVKDSVQFKERIKRIARKVRRKHEEIDEDGLLVKGVAYFNTQTQIKPILRSLLKEEFHKELIIINDNRRRLEFHISLLDKILKADSLVNFTKIGILRKYPDRDLEVEFIPIK